MVHEILFDQTVPSQKVLWNNLSCFIHDYMISSKKSVKKKDRIKYFKEIVEVDINFN